MEEIILLTVIIIVARKNENWLIIIVGTINNNCVLVLLFLLFIPSPWRETKMFGHQVKVEIGKSTYIQQHQSRNADSGGKQTTFPSISSLKGRALSLFRQNNGRTSSVRDRYQSVYSRAEISLTSEPNAYSIFGKILNISINRESKIK